MKIYKLYFKYPNQIQGKFILNFLPKCNSRILMEIMYLLNLQNFSDIKEYLNK